MAFVLLVGASSGALHAVSGPDHVLSLSPVAIARPRQAFRVGLTWGLGHALGTLLLAVPLLLGSTLLPLYSIAVWSERIAGAVLIVTAVTTYVTRTRDTQAPSSARGPLWVGLLHGATGAGALVLMLPMVANYTLFASGIFLVAFAAGSTLAMALLTAALGKLGARFEQRALRGATLVASAASLGLGLYWLIAA